jgi:hypothetical protein
MLKLAWLLAVNYVHLVFEIGVAITELQTQDAHNLPLIATPISTSESNHLSISENHFSTIQSRVAESNITKNNNDTPLAIECPVTFQQFTTGEYVAVLYNSSQYTSETELFADQTARFHCFSERAAEHILADQMAHPLTRQPVDSYAMVYIDSLTPPTQVESGLQSLLSICVEVSNDLANSFQDMVKELLPLQHELHNFLTFTQGDAFPNNLDTTELSTQTQSCANTNAISLLYRGL